MLYAPKATGFALLDCVLCLTSQLTMHRHHFQPPAQSMSDSSSLIPRMYSTLLHRMNTSPRLPRKLPSTHSSVLRSCKFMYGSMDFNVPLYSMPHFNFTRINLPVRSFKN